MIDFFVFNSLIVLFDYYFAFSIGDDGCWFAVMFAYLRCFVCFGFSRSLVCLCWVYFGLIALGVGFDCVGLHCVSFHLILLFTFCGMCLFGKLWVSVLGFWV